MWFFTNWSYEPQYIERVPLKGYELFSNETFEEGGSLTLGAWDTKVIVARA